MMIDPVTERFNLKKQSFLSRRKNYSAHKTFGSNLVSGKEILFVSPVLNQDDAGPANDCTAYSACAARANMTGKTYDPNKFWIDELTEMGVSEANGATLVTEMSVGKKYGFANIDTGVHEDKASGYFEVTRNNGMDFFDSIRSAMETNNCPLLCGIDWYTDWFGSDRGVIPNRSSRLLGGHAFKIAGFTWSRRDGTPLPDLPNGDPYLVKQGSWGVNAPGSDQGFYYFTRDQVNRLFGSYGTFFWSDVLKNQIRILGLIAAILEKIQELIARSSFKTSNA